MYDATDCESKLDKFYLMINKTIVDHVPLHKWNHSDFSSWFNCHSTSSILEKNRAPYRYKLSQLESDYIEFKRLRDVCIRKRRFCYAEYFDKVQSSIKVNLKYFWSHVNSKRKMLDIPGSVFLNDVEVEEGHDIVKLFAIQFKNSSILSDPILPPLRDLLVLVSDVTITA